MCRVFVSCIEFASEYVGVILLRERDQAFQNWCFDVKMASGGVCHGRRCRVSLKHPDREVNTSGAVSNIHTYRAAVHKDEQYLLDHHNLSLCSVSCAKFNKHAFIQSKDDLDLSDS